MTGQTLGNYKILSQAGEGSMGAVYHAVDLMLDREVALKALRPELTGQTDVVVRFREEARVQARLNHPNVAQLYSLFSHGDDLFMVMEFVKGPTLDNIIRHVGRMTFDQALPIFLQVLDGVEHAHRMGIIHRDLKPSNIMIAQDGLVKVTDFGIARVLGTARVTREGVMIGTLEYMSPEAILGRNMDARSDLYSLGFVFFEMLNGSPPFTGGTEYELMLSQVETPPPPIRSCVPDVHPEIEAAIFKAMQKDPGDRYPSIAEFAAVLRKFALDMPAAGSFTIALAQNFRSGESYSELRGPAGETRLADVPCANAISVGSSAVAAPLPAWVLSQNRRFRYFIIGIIGVTALTSWFVIRSIPMKNQSVVALPSPVPPVTAHDPLPPAPPINDSPKETPPPLFSRPTATNLTSDRQAVKPEHLAQGDVSRISETASPPIGGGNNGLKIIPQKTTDYTPGASDPAGTTSRNVTAEVATDNAPPAPMSSSQVGNSDIEAQQTYANAQTALAARRWADAAALFGRAARLKPGWREPLVERARLDVKLGRFPDAIEDSSEALRLKPDDAVTLNIRGLARCSVNQITEAIADFSEAIRLKPDYSDAYKNRGNAKWALGNKEGANADFDTEHLLDKKVR